MEVVQLKVRAKDAGCPQGLSVGKLIPHFSSLERDAQHTRKFQFFHLGDGVSFLAAPPRLN